MTNRAYELRIDENACGRTNEAIGRMLADISKLAPDIISQAAEMESARRMPPDFVETLKSIGVFRLFVPRSHGGLECAMRSPER